MNPKHRGKHEWLFFIKRLKQEKNHTLNFSTKDEDGHSFIKINNGNILFSLFASFNWEASGHQVLISLPFDKYKDVLIEEMEKVLNNEIVKKTEW